MSRGERGPIGDDGAAGVAGERGPAGDQGVAGERGLIGLIGTVGAIGERGPAGDHGQAGDHGIAGPTGAAGIEGPRGVAGHDGFVYTQPRSKTALVLGLLSLLVLLTTVGGVVWFVFSGEAADDRRLDELQTELDDRNAEHAQLSAEAIALDARLREERDGEQALEDCLDLYSDDIRAGVARSQIALSDLFNAIVVRPTPLTDEEREAGRLLNVGLVEIVVAANDPLRMAVAALDEYKSIDPSPAQCPHPRTP